MPIRRIERLFRGISHWLAPLLAVPLWLLWLPLYAIRGLARFIADILLWAFRSWWDSTQFWNLLKGLPALALVIGTALLVVSIRSNKAMGTTYKREARRAVLREDLDAAEIYYQRAVEIVGERADVVYEISQLAFASGDVERGNMLIDRVAPIESRGHAPAHIFRAKQILTGAKDFEAFALAETHLIHATSRPQRYPEADAMLGKLYMQTMEIEEAIHHLERACALQPEYSLYLAKAYSLARDRESAEKHAQVAIDYFQAQSMLDPTNLRLRFNWAEACSFALRFEQAIKILQRGLALEGDESLIRKAMGEVHLAWFDHLVQSGSSSADQFDVLAAGVSANPAEVNFLQRGMTIMRRDDETAEKLRRLLRKKIAAGEASALAHLILGTDSLEKDKADQAITHLELAIKLDPNMGFAANNLAWTLAHQENPDLERAYQLIDTLADRWPDYAAYRDTRGQILVKMERWDEALEDLQAALDEYSDYQPLHRALATVYEKLDLPDLAAEHRRIADSLPPVPGAPK